MAVSDHQAPHDAGPAPDQHGEELCGGEGAALCDGDRRRAASARRQDCITEENLVPVSEGSEFIVQEAMRESDEPLYIALQAGLTDLAAAYLTEPKIAEKITAAIWIGDGAYHGGGKESNLQQDIEAARILFDSPLPIWQVPLNVYGGMNISFAELVGKVKPCGKVGALLAEKMFAVSDFCGSLPIRTEFPHGEIWSIGDQPTVSVLLENPSGQRYHEERAPRILDDTTYGPNPDSRAIRVYDGTDRRLTMDDFFEKLALCYGSQQ
ncbi:MAG: nucleoside hydrolase [Firmicutes bacterium]|nr:nucleoside hydrolase [Bacillota bacterium]